MTRATRIATTLAMVALAVTLAGCTPSGPGVGATPAVTTEAVHATPGTAKGWRPVDLGAREGATGAVTLDAEGAPVEYGVAAGDTPDAIRARLDLPWFSLAREDGSFMAREVMIVTGETLTFTLPRQ